MTMDDTRVIHLKLNFVQTELPQTSSPSPFSPWPTRAKILAEFCRVFSSKTQVYCICTRRTTTTAYSTDISRYSSYKYFGSTEHRGGCKVAWGVEGGKFLFFVSFFREECSRRFHLNRSPSPQSLPRFLFPPHPSLICYLFPPPFIPKVECSDFPDFTLPYINN